MKTNFARLGQGLLDLLYPPICLLCGDRTEAGVCCIKCVATFLPIPEPTCPICGRPAENSPCGTCQRFAEETGMAFAFDSACSSAVYVGALRHAIHLLKYRGKEHLGLPLGAFLANRLIADGLLTAPGDIQKVMFVPMHATRERWRGYNQAHLLAEPVAEMLGVPLVTGDVLIRTRKTAQQVGLSDKERRKNIPNDIFAVRDPSVILGQRVLLIDDVFTTGATVSACAFALKEAGAGFVQVATLAAGG